MALLPALLAACAPASFAPSLDLAADAMPPTFPADTTLLVGVEFAPVRSAPLRPEIDRWAQELGGADVMPLVNDVTRVMLGCFDEGCVALVEGEFRGFAPEALAERVPSAIPRARGVDLRTPLGPIVARRLGPKKAVAGDRRAVARVATERRLGEPGLDPARLDGLVPAGEVWAAAWGRDVLEALGDRLGIQLPDVPDDVEAASVSVALDPIEPLATVRARVRCAGEGDAEAWARLAEAEVARRGLDAGVVRRDTRVEVAWEVDAEGLAALRRGTSR